jgi:hypothetical protein
VSTIFGAVAEGCAVGIFSPLTFDCAHPDNPRRATNKAVMIMALFMK